MNIETFLAHHGLKENPFNAEEARHDPVFARLSETTTTHPDFGKILGRIDAPSTSIVFGEKGSGKTAIRLLIGKKVAEHNAAYPESRTLLIPYDDLNPMLDRLQQRHGGSAQDVLQKVRLADHQDAILSQATTRVVDALLGQGTVEAEPLLLPDGLHKRIKKLPRQVRIDLAMLAALYDQPPSGALVPRWRSLARTLRLGVARGLGALRLLAIALSIVAVIGLIAYPFIDTQPLWPVQVLLALLIAGATVSWGVFGWLHLTLRLRCRRIRREMPAIDRSVGELAAMLGGIRARERMHMTLPGVLPGAAKDTNAAAHSDARYQLTRRLLDVLAALGYRGIIVLVDRVDEPTLISGHPDRMRPVVWPMFDNKLLQQDRVGVILLLPIELRYLVQRESSEFYQHARLDKQSMIDRLSWSGATLYDLCTARLRACLAAGSESGGPVFLTSLFTEDVTREMLIDALDQMHQPRDAFKFLYAVIQEHCRTVPEDQPQWQIPRLTLESIRRGQAQRVQELFRGLAPA